MSKATEWAMASRQDRAEECVRQGKMMKYIHGDELLIVPDSKIRGFLAFCIKEESNGVLTIKESLGAVGPELKDMRDVNHTGNVMTEAGLPVRMDLES